MTKSPESYYFLDVVFVYNCRLKGAEPDPEVVAFRHLYLIEHREKVGQLVFRSFLCSVQCCVDPGQNDFSHSGVKQHACLLHYLLRRPASYRSARIRDKAVGAESVATFLNLDVGSCHSRFARFDKAHVFVFGQFGARQYEHLRIRSISLCTMSITTVRRLCLKQLEHEPAYLRLLSVADNHVDFRHRRHFLRLDLGVAPGHDDERIRIDAFYTPDILPRLPVSDVRDSACIDDIYICRIFFPYRNSTTRNEGLSHGLRLVVIDFASKCMKSDSHPENVCTPMH